MLNAKYREAWGILEQARYELNKIYEADPGATSEEDKEAYYILEDIISRLESAANSIEYLKAPPKEGRLREESNGKFYIEYKDGTSGYLLSCGNRLEIRDGDQWQIGRVEAKNGKYYFYGDTKPNLYEGMEARTRILD